MVMSTEIPRTRLCTMCQVQHTMPRGLVRRSRGKAVHGSVNISRYSAHTPSNVSGKWVYACGLSQKAELLKLTTEPRAARASLGLFIKALKCPPGRGMETRAPHPFSSWHFLHWSFRVFNWSMRWAVCLQQMSSGGCRAGRLQSVP